MIPQTYAEWRQCIEHECKILLTPDYIATRLAVLQDKDREETRRFSELYGAPHLQRTVEWFRQAQRIFLQ